ncbi:Cobalamin synthesis protein cobW C-terminal domain-containing protein [Lachnospiraceae bacterium A10]|nr:Cobalamin synthesis protein cobW C-terminal domain-containing protein [Lachnospiraceae bacterium A10]
MTKIDIYSGFLGAGKTTLIKKMIAEVFAGQKIVLIENEYGEVGIDGGFLKDSGIQITEMNSGCICCTLVGDFDKNLREVIDTYHPDRIIIEPSGVGKLSDVMTSVTNLEKDYDIELNALVTVVNALKAAKQMKAFGEFFNNQIEFATTVILSRTQKATAEQVEFCTSKIKELNEKAVVITTPWEELSGEKILSAMEGNDNLALKLMAEEAHKKEEAEHHHHHHDHEEHEHHHDHDHDHHHEHGEDCTCGCHDHDHEHEHEHHHNHDHDHEHHHEHGEGCTCGCHDHEGHHHADDVFESYGRETPHVFTREVIENACKKFVDTEEYGYVLRSKGMVPAEDGTWIYFDLVDGEYELRTGEPDVTGKLVVIGTDIDEHALDELFGLA